MSKLGELKRCPACGEIIPILKGVCPSCGYTFNLSTTDLILVEKLEKDCHELAKVPFSRWTLFYALLLLGGGVIFFCVTSNILDEETRIVIGMFGFAVPFFYMGAIFVSNDEDKKEKRIVSSDFKPILFDINSKIESAKLLYSADVVANARVIGLEKMVERIVQERKNRTKILLISSVIVSIILIIAGLATM